MPYKDSEKAKEYHRNYSRKWMAEQRIKHPEKWGADAQAQRREADPKGRLLVATRQSAKIKNLEHNIDRDDLTLPEICPYIGIKIDYTAGNGKTLEKPSVDRIDPSKGYIKGNVEVISSLANTMKNKATKRMLQNFALEILNRWPL